MASIYNTGTVTVTNGSAAVVGVGTAWAVSLVTGGLFTRLGVAIPILSVTDDTHLTLAYPWPGATAAAAAYAIDRENSSASNIVDLYDKLTRVLLQLSLAGITPNNSGTLTKRDALTLGAGDDNYLYLHAEIGVAFAFYRWDGPSLAWVGPFSVANAVATGGVSSLVSGTGITVDSTNPAIPVVKLANMANATIKGRTTAGAGAPEDMTMAQVKALLLAGVVIRDVLTANRTYYVRTDGNDANTGLVNNAGGAFLTIQKAVNVALTLDLSTFNVTIQCAAGSYAATVSVTGAFTGSGAVTILGDTTTPANVVVGSVTVDGAGSKISVGGLKITGSLFASKYGTINYAGKMELSGSATQLQAQEYGVINFAGAVLIISGGGGRCIYTLIGGYVTLFSANITLTGTPAFSIAFADSQRAGFLNINAVTFTGTATGSRFIAQSLGVINTGGGGASYLPGSVAGTGTNPGVSPYGLYI